MDMNRGKDLKRYEKYGWDYETVCELTAEEVHWYERWAKQTGGPILGLACGTARLLCRLGLAGFDVTGLDLSDTMLSQARKNIAKLPATARKRIRLVKDDMLRFQLRGTFGLILIADNSFRELNTRGNLLTCLRNIRRHLQPEGKLLITERRFNPSMYPGNRRSFGWSQPKPYPGTGNLVSRRGEIRLAKNHKRISGTFFYKTYHADGSELIEKCPWSGPVRLFDRVGFTTQTFADYTNNKDDGRSTFLCFVCEMK
jgi:SAM-dependent methyltransferase